MSEKLPIVYCTADADHAEYYEQQEQRNVIAKIRRLSINILKVKEDLASLSYYYYNQWIEDLPLEQQRPALLREHEKRRGSEKDSEEVLQRTRQELQTLEEERNQLLFSLPPHIFDIISKEIDYFTIKNLKQWEGIVSSYPNGYKIKEEPSSNLLTTPEEKLETLASSIRAIDKECLDLREEIALLVWYQDFLNNTSSTNSDQQPQRFREEVLYATKHELDRKNAMRFRLALRLDPNIVKKLNEQRHLEEEAACASGRELSESHGFSFLWEEKARISAEESLQRDWIIPDMEVLKNQFDEIDPRIKFVVFRPIRLDPTIAQRRSAGSNKISSNKCGREQLDQDLQPLGFVTASSVLDGQIENNLSPGTLDELLTFAKTHHNEGDVVVLGSLGRLIGEWFVLIYNIKDGKKRLNLRRFNNARFATSDSFLSVANAG